MEKRFIILFFITLYVGYYVNFSYSQVSNIKEVSHSLCREAQRYEREGNLEKSIEFYEKAYNTSTNPEFKKTVLILIGQVYEKKKDYKKAIEVYRKYLEIASNAFEIVEGKRKIAYVYVYKGEYSKGIKLLDEIIEEYSKEKYPGFNFAADAQFSKAAIYHNFIKDYEKAVEEYKKMVEEYPDDWRVKEYPIVFVKMAACYIELKKYDNAIEIYQRVIKQHRGRKWEEFAKAQIEILNNYYKKGIDLKKIFTEKMEMVDTRIRQKKYSKGIKLLDEIIEEYSKEKYPGFNFAADAQFSKAAIYHNFIKDYEKAVEEYKKMVEEYPDDWRVKEDPIVFVKMAACYIELKKYDNAIEIYQRVIKQHRGRKWEEFAKAQIEILNNYYKKGIEPSLEELKSVMRNYGLEENFWFNL